MARYDRVEDILRLAIEMQNSYQGFSIQDIQDEFEVSRRTAIRMKDAVERLFPSIEEVQNPTSRVKKWRLNKTSLNKMISFTAEEFAELENCKSMMKNMMTKMTRMTKTMRIVTIGIWKMTAVR